MLKACSISKSINRQAVKVLREKNISIDVWSGENSPTQDELKCPIVKDKRSKKWIMLSKKVNSSLK